MSTREFYETRAAECGRDADTATLQNVRERALRAQAAWLGMASRIERGDRMRATLAAEKAVILAESRASALAAENENEDATLAESATAFN